eukprot:CAMPEP_0181226664 /NCGR_PEP_ID=MMETSP1096-20121128/32377_1 /TAXON_ID=156174 ORGANISM="Chrysochromulina ericina, Strain CCMP281" /NCGR_SAMPLE_ID=MMETSP1096 /ASSEMBLY_ACC=CAM_ASM_000453 /LENGTH=50 /DNA_ID=CAMNT_0023320021 /DNA_START=158 /DNA_END=310 /DNA_ORIENTATION=+
MKLKQPSASPSSANSFRLSNNYAMHASRLARRNGKMTEAEAWSVVKPSAR